jgi:hypothetical protein
MPAMQRLLLILGLSMIVAGLLWPWLSKLPWGRLPGDISIEGPGFSFHFPLTTSLVISVGKSAAMGYVDRSRARRFSNEGPSRKITGRPMRARVHWPDNFREDATCLFASHH